MEKNQTAGKPKARIRVEWPRSFRVVFYNDDFTTMDFVVMVLRVVFFKKEAEAQRLMMAVHKQGKATVGVYPRDIAMSKTDKATKMAKDAGYPLRITCEEE
ncbi:MAG: ATP-dependent Clp protease adaptor ClpS [Prevotellaceae bacterium]|nr:ATP-dependent Clp protease adaptor ClpS [Prevotellaceae bacterium]MCD8303290.1 ATP-dependent Clp protease adaptor ClpS [Prevotellaceae bacterium]